MRQNRGVVLLTNSSGHNTPRSGKAERGDFAVDEEDSVSGVRSLRTEKAENGPMSTGVQ